jgi:transposase
VADLPVSGRSVRLAIQVRRFRCLASPCPRRIFAERLPGLVAAFARKTHGLRQALEQIGFANGGEAGARLAAHLGMATSPDTLLRFIRAAPCPDVGQPTSLGIDDWAYKRGRRYGTIICDLVEHRPVDLLPDRSAESTAAWLAAHPSVEVIARDRSGLYADAATRGAPEAVQVADRWHLVDNLADALETFLRHHGAHLIQAAALAAQTDEPAADSALPDAMYQGKRCTPPPRLWEQRQEAASAERVAARQATYKRVHELYAKGTTPAEIARLVGVARTTVYRYLQSAPPQRPRRTQRGRQRVLAPWEPYLLKRWEEGCHTATRLWREIREMGFAYSVTCVQRFCVRLRLEGASPRTLQRERSPYTSVRGPSAREVASLFVQWAERRTTEQVAYLEALCQSEPLLLRAYTLTQDFLTLVRERHGARLDAWLEAAGASTIRALERFALSLREDYAAVKAGLTRPESNGQTEGQINRLKLIKRAMYGRGKFDLLRQRVLHAA